MTSGIEDVCKFERKLSRAQATVAVKKNTEGPGGRLTAISSDDPMGGEDAGTAAS